MSHTIHLIAAARPNFMKIAPLYHELTRHEWANPVIVHTGQHYDINMSDAFFSDLNLPDPHIHLGAGSGSHAEQTGRVMITYERTLLETQPDMVVVVGDVNSTIACTLAAAKIQYSSDAPRSRPIIAHLEAGLRSFDRTMPEEINRLATDVLADVLWTPSIDGDENLAREGIDPAKISRVGNIMIDSFEMLRPKIEAAKTAEELDFEKGKYAVATLHRPANVDCPMTLSNLCNTLERIANKIPIIFPVHPRTRKNLEHSKLVDKLEKNPNIKLLEPLNYIRFMNLVLNSKMVITDSGGVQEETTYLQIPCLTLRPNTERPITVTQGTNELCTIGDVEKQVDNIIAGKYKQGVIPELWDGHTAARTADSIKSYLKA
ncbi:MAG TPA: UDP-N-acetylglucosamine 2-epimerase (non-hydrolyzing) [Gammaproteobacteria bacterium]|nr:UDP-N-acetylglucosamine 2-epimerase (non-hydrolyzing) [Gammaproteobacteria bacterium]